MRMRMPHVVYPTPPFGPPTGAAPMPPTSVLPRIELDVDQAFIENRLTMGPEIEMNPAAAAELMPVVIGWLRSAGARIKRTTISPELAGFLADQLSKGRG